MKRVCMVVITHGKRTGVAVEVDKDYPKSFYHCGAWYVWEREYNFWAEEDM